jgi:hypothetical protein
MMRTEVEIQVNGTENKFEEGAGNFPKPKKRMVIHFLVQDTFRTPNSQDQKRTSQYHIKH